MSAIDRIHHLRVDNWILANQREANQRFADYSQRDPKPVLPPIPEPPTFSAEERRYNELFDKKMFNGYYVTDAENAEYFALVRKLYPAGILAGRPTP